LDRGRRERTAHEPEDDVEDLEHGGRLHARGYRADGGVGGTGAGVERGEMGREKGWHPDEGRCCTAGEERVVQLGLLRGAEEVGEGTV